MNGPYRDGVLGSTLASTLRTLRRPRYAALSVLMVVVALVCVAAGTWQIVRLGDKVAANDDLRVNSRSDAVAVVQLLPLTGAHASVSETRVRFRTVTATGTFEPDRESYVRNRNVNDRGGWLVLTPLRSARADLLVVRGFVASTSSGARPPVAAAPTGQVTVRARVQLAEKRNDGALHLSHGEVESINPSNQQSRLARPVYDGYAELLARQPGTFGLTPIPGPDLANPAGGAIEPQHFAYIVQWYLFALLALAAPLAMARAERRELAASGLDGAPAVDMDPERARAARLADRYGRSLR